MWKLRRSHVEAKYTISKVKSVAVVEFIKRKLPMNAVECFTTTHVTKHVAIKLMAVLCQRLETLAHERQRPREHIMYVQ